MNINRCADLYKGFFAGLDHSGACSQNAKQEKHQQQFQRGNRHCNVVNVVSQCNVIQ